MTTLDDFSHVFHLKRQEVHAERGGSDLRVVRSVFPGHLLHSRDRSFDLHAVFHADPKKSQGEGGAGDRRSRRSGPASGAEAREG